MLASLIWDVPVFLQRSPADVGKYVCACLLNWPDSSDGSNMNGLVSAGSVNVLLCLF